MLYAIYRMTVIYKPNTGIIAKVTFKIEIRKNHKESNNNSSLVCFVCDTFTSGFVFHWATETPSSLPVTKSRKISRDELEVVNETEQRERAVLMWHFAVWLMSVGGTIVSMARSRSEICTDRRVASLKPGRRGGWKCFQQTSASVWRDGTALKTWASASQWDSKGARLYWRCYRSLNNLDVSLDIWKHFQPSLMWTLTLSAFWGNTTSSQVVSKEGESWETRSWISGEAVEFTAVVSNSLSPAGFHHKPEHQQRSRGASSEATGRSQRTQIGVVRITFCWRPLDGRAPSSGRACFFLSVRLSIQSFLLSVVWQNTSLIFLRVCLFLFFF